MPGQKHSYAHDGESSGGEVDEEDYYETVRSARKKRKQVRVLIGKDKRACLLINVCSCLCARPGRSGNLCINARTRKIARHGAHAICHGTWRGPYATSGAPTLGYRPRR